MICVSIGRGRHRHVIAEHKHLAEQGAKLVELRLDYISGQVNLQRVLHDRPTPVIITLRRHQDGGKWPGTEEARQLLLRTAIVQGVDYVDLEEDVAAKVPRYGKTKRIISLHDFRKTPDDLPAIHARLRALDADIVKIATLANDPHDNLRMLDLVKNAEVPTIGICMGEMGIPTRVLCGKYGSPFTYATFHQERSLAPGQLSFQQMQELYGYEQINAETEVYGVIGDPIAQSMSPLVHNKAFRQAGLNKVYLPFRIPREDVGSFLDEAQRLDIRGLSVTIPHKEAILKKLTKVDGGVKGVGAANTILFKDNEVIGYNTDYRGAMDSLEKAMNLPHGAPEPLKGKTAMVLGAGGAAKAIAYGLKRRGAEVIITGRTLEHAEALAKRLECKSLEWGARHAPAIDILINCTPIGMHPNVDEAPYEKHRLRPSMVVFDTVYNPETTLLVKEAKVKGCNVITGVAMFIRQAALQYELFTGQPAPEDLMREELKKAIGPVKY
jgi:3-dehydroquinate dehydratase/shikimate dehydrogenase